MVKKIWTNLSSVVSQSMHFRDGETDRQTPFSWLVHDGIPYNAVK